MEVISISCTGLWNTLCTTTGCSRLFSLGGKQEVSPPSPAIGKVSAFSQAKQISPHPAWEIFCIVFAVKEPVPRDQTGKFCALLRDSSILFPRLNVVFHGSDNRGRIETMRGWNSLLACCGIFFFSFFEKREGKLKREQRIVRVENMYSFCRQFFFSFFKYSFSYSLIFDDNSREIYI